MTSDKLQIICMTCGNSYDFPSISCPFCPKKYTPSIMIATPCKDGTVDVNYAVSLAATGEVLTSAGIRYQTAHTCTSSIDNGRSVLATLFLRSTCTHLLFVDDDMAWASDLPLRLLNENVDIVGVPYRKKKGVPEYTLKLSHPNKIASLEDRPYMILADAIGMGMTLIHRRVFEKLKPTIPQYYCSAHDGDDYQLLFFRHELIKDADGRIKYESEDFHFCRLARQVGFEIFAYVDEDVPHIGRKSFGGSYSEHIGIGVPHGFTSKRSRHFVNLSGIEK